jgi:signal peptidase I
MARPRGKTADWWTRMHQFVRGYGLMLLVMVVSVTSFRSALADWNDVPTGSMRPTILEGDRIFVNKLAYDLKLPYTKIRLARWADPQHGDIVVCFSPADGTRLVKRVVGVPGDVIAMQNNRVFLNGQPLAYALDEGQLSIRGRPEREPAHRYLVEDLTGQEHLVATTPGQRSLNTFAPLEIPPDCYFVMGDNRDNSADSRYFGFVARRNIAGKVTAVVLSFDRDNWYWPRWQRFFSHLL